MYYLRGWISLRLLLGCLWLTSLSLISSLTRWLLTSVTNRWLILWAGPISVVTLGWSSYCWGTRCQNLQWTCNMVTHWSTVHRTVLIYEKQVKPFHSSLWTLQSSAWYASVALWIWIQNEPSLWVHSIKIQFEMTKVGLKLVNGRYSTFFFRWVALVLWVVGAQLTLSLGVSLNSQVIVDVSIYSSS